MINVSERKWKKLILYIVAQLCHALSFAQQLTLYPKEAGAKGAAPYQYGVVFGVYYLTVLIASPFFGKFIPKIGTKLMCVTGLFTLGITNLLFGLLDMMNGSTTFIAFSLVIRIIEGVGMASYRTALFSDMTNEFSDSIGKVFGVLEASYGVGFILGPIIGGALYEAGGFILPFLIVGTLILCIMILIAFIVPECNDNPKELCNERGYLSLIRMPFVTMAAFVVICAHLISGFYFVTIEPHLRPITVTPLKFALLVTSEGIAFAVAALIWGKICDKWSAPQYIWSLGAILACLSILTFGPPTYIPLQLTMPICTVLAISYGIGVSAEIVAAFYAMNKFAIEDGFEDDITTYGLTAAIFNSSATFGSFAGSLLAGFLVVELGFKWAAHVYAGFQVILLVTTVCLFSFSTKSVLIRQDKPRMSKDPLLN